MLFSNISPCAAPALRYKSPLFIHALSGGYSVFRGGVVVDWEWVAMFESLTSSLSGFFNKIAGRGKKLSEADIREGLRTVRMSLLEADVALPVVRSFIEKVTVKAIGAEVIASVNPSQQIVKVVHDELIVLMGPVDSRIAYKTDGNPTVILMAGLQGSGKTTTCAKLVHYLKRQGHKPLLVAADLQRPAAIEQLKVLGEQLDTPVFSENQYCSAGTLRSGDCVCQD